MQPYILDHSYKQVSGPFDTFLKVDASVDERDPAVFSTFLKAFTGVAPGATGGKAQAVANGHHAAAAVEKAMPIKYGWLYGLRVSHLGF